MRYGWQLFRTATAAGLIGLAVFHADAIATITTKVVGTFRAAVKLADTKGAR